MVYKRFPRLEERKKQMAGTLSGGEQQMLAMGRALMSKPKIILMDEPSMGLSPIFVNEIFDIIKAVSASGTTVLDVYKRQSLISVFIHMVQQRLLKFWITSKLQVTNIQQSVPSLYLFQI